MSRKTTVNLSALVAAPVPSPAICNLFGISSDCQRCQYLVCFMCCYLLLQLVQMCDSTSAWEGVQGAVLWACLGVGLNLVLRNGLSLPEQRGLYLLCFVQGGYHKWMSSSWGFGSGELFSRYKADNGTQATRVGQVSYLVGRIFLAGRSSFAPVLCCGPSLQRIKAFLSLLSIV